MRYKFRFSFCFVSLLFAGLQSVAQAPAFYTNGNKVYDPCGNPITLRGVNFQTDFSSPSPFSSNFAAEIKQTGANTVRIEWFTSPTSGNQFSALQMDQILTEFSNAGMLPIIELHDLADITCGGNMNVLQNKIVPYYTRSDIKAVLKKHEQHLIVNFANELGTSARWGGNITTYKNAYKSAVTEMRNAGFQMPLLIDAPDCGTAILEVLNNNIAAEIVQSDPLHNIIFSAHTYWLSYPNWSNTKSSDWDVVLQQIANASVPVILGEVSTSQYISNTEPCKLVTDYQRILNQATKLGIGLVWWSWTNDECKDNSPSDRNISIYAAGGKFNTLTIVGKDVVFNNNYGLKTQTKPIPFLSDGQTCSNKLQFGEIKSQLITSPPTPAIIVSAGVILNKGDEISSATLWISNNGTDFNATRLPPQIQADVAKGNLRLVKFADEDVYTTSLIATTSQKWYKIELTNSRNKTFTSPTTGLQFKRIYTKELPRKPSFPVKIGTVPIRKQ